MQGIQGRLAAERCVLSPKSRHTSGAGCTLAEPEVVAPVDEMVSLSA
jgi:hypothetical protein